MYDQDEEGKRKKERSPSYPFIPLRRAVARAEALYEGHRREPTRLAALGQTWGYSPASSGLQQTVAALKQFGLIEEEGSGYDRKVKISDLARRIVADLRPGAREQAIKEAATKPKLVAEYLSRWLPTRPTDAHCISELHIDRGFSKAAAQQFLKVFDDTVSYAGLAGNDMVPEIGPASDELSPEGDTYQGGGASAGGEGWKPLVPPPVLRNAGETPLSERLQVVTTGNQLTVSAALVSPKEVDKLIRILQANKLLLDDEEEEQEAD